MIGIKDGIADRHVQKGRVRFLFKLVIIENFNEHEISQLLNDGKWVCHAIRPKNIPNTIDLVFKFTGNHIKLPTSFIVPKWPDAIIVYCMSLTPYRFDQRHP